MTLTHIKLAFRFNIAGIVSLNTAFLSDPHSAIIMQNLSDCEISLVAKNKVIESEQLTWKMNQSETLYKTKNANSYCTGERSLFRSPQKKTTLFLLMGDILTVFSMKNEFYLRVISYEIQKTERSSHLWPVSLFSKPSSMFLICIYEFLLPGLKMSLSTLLFYSRYSYIFGDNQEL